MKSVSKNLRMALANYREMLDFSRFGSDLDKSTKKIISHGGILLETLKQKQYRPYPTSREAIEIYVAQSGALDDVDPQDVYEIFKLLYNVISSQANEIYLDIDTKDLFPQETQNRVIEFANNIKANFVKTEVN